jgi:hypothetical protein
MATSSSLTTALARRNITVTLRSMAATKSQTHGRAGGETTSSPAESGAGRGDAELVRAAQGGDTEALERAGVQLQTGIPTGNSRDRVLLPDPGVDPPVSTWKVVALAGMKVLGEVIAVVRGAGASPTYLGVVVAVDPVVAERLAGS